MTKTIEVSGYDPLGFQEEVDITLHIHGTPPRLYGDDWEAQHRDWLDRQAKTVMDVVMNNLPQGVSWRVLIKMLQKHHVLYVGNDLHPTKDARDLHESLSWAMDWLALYVEPDHPNADAEWKDNWERAKKLLESTS